MGLGQRAIERRAGGSAGDDANAKGLAGGLHERGAGGDGSGSEAAEGLVRGVEPAADESKADGGVEALQADGEGGELRDGGAQAAVGGDLDAVVEVVEALGTAADESL